MFDIPMVMARSEAFIGFPPLAPDHWVTLRPASIGACFNKISCIYSPRITPDETHAAPKQNLENPPACEPLTCKSCAALHA